LLSSPPGNPLFTAPDLCRNFDEWGIGRLGRGRVSDSWELGKGKKRKVQEKEEVVSEVKKRDQKIEGSEDYDS